MSKETVPNYGELKRMSILSHFGKAAFINPIPVILRNLKPKKGSDDLTKSHISDAFDNTLTKIKKSGKEVKEKAAEVLKHEVAEKDKYYAEAVALAGQLSEVGSPDCEVGEWSYRGTESKFTNKLKVFSWDQIYKNDPVRASSEVEMASPNPEKPKEGETVSDKMKRYNELVSKYVDCGSEVYLLETLNNSLSDTKEYEFSLRQLAVLGF